MGSRSAADRAAAGSAVLAAVVLLSACSGSSGTLTADGRPSAAPAHSSTERPPASLAPPDEAARAAPAALRKGERTEVLRIPGGPYQPSVQDGSLDDYRCFLLDPGLREDAFVTGSDVLPGNPAVVHHAILFAVAPDMVGAAEAQDAATPGQGWTCFGDAALPDAGGSAAARLNSAPWLAAWAPGGGETVFGSRTGKRLAAGSRIVLQMHYNLREGTEPDETAVRLRLMPGTADLRTLETMLLVAPVELPCGGSEAGRLCDRSQSVLDLVGRFGDHAGRTVSGLQLLCGGSMVSPRAGPTQSCERRAPDDLVVRMVAGHMHLLGRSISVDLAPGTPDRQQLLDRPVWDFDDQKATTLPRPVRVRRGDVLRVTCTHDAALRSMVPELAKEEPRYVTWGEGTSDEMCLGIVLYTRD